MCVFVFKTKQNGALVAHKGGVGGVIGVVGNKAILAIGGVGGGGGGVGGGGSNGDGSGDFRIDKLLTFTSGIVTGSGYLWLDGPLYWSGGEYLHVLLSAICVCVHLCKFTNGIVTPSMDFSGSMVPFIGAVVSNYTFL
jgi:hypothetical protein